MRFQYYNPEAAEVHVAGSFNDWDSKSAPMVRLSDGRWLREVKLPAGQYEYRLIVDGRWLEDVMSAQFAWNPFGDLNSVVRVGNP
ncbi:MAG TPA: isoamylase early set domain-containing protein [Candidatus Limnocylindria bacterium]|nr:isoamylase early set domain-containing protein [Candidatus Limnocylindria bacterium]